MLTPLNNSVNNSNISFSGSRILSKLGIRKIDSPKYGINYRKGDIGFTFHTKSIMASAISYFTRWHRSSHVKVAHSFIVVDGSTCVEALAETGVREKKLTDYFNDKNTIVFFRRPKGITKEIANEIAENAKKEVGKKYANSLIWNMVGRGTILGHLIDTLTKNKTFDRQSLLLNKDGSFLCSELVAHCLQKIQQWPFHNEGILKRPAAGINPQELFEDENIFKPGRIKLNKA